MADQAVPSCRGCGGRCCEAYIVPLTGYDVWALSRALPLEPIQFVRREPEDYPTDTGFRLGPSRPSYGLALRHDAAGAGERPCVFLLAPANGARLCRIYAHRPLACQAYPMRNQHGAVAARAEMLCPPSSWAGGLPGSGELLRRQDRAWRDYAAVVAAWNAALRDQTGPAGYVLTEFLAYVVRAYDAFEQLRMPDLSAPPRPVRPALEAFAGQFVASL